MQEESIVLLTLGSFQITAYSALMAGAGLLAILLTLIVGKKRIGADHALSVGLCGLLGAVIGGHLVYCLTNIGSVLADYESGIALLWRLNLGGYTLYGAILGGIAAICLYGLITRQELLPLLDAAAPGTLLAVAIGRGAEYFTNQGLGEWLDEEVEALLRFPFAVAIRYDEDYVEWRVPVFVYEAAAALIILLALLLLLRKKQVPGRIAGTALTLLGLTQIFLEQLRQDDFIRFGFVRFSQLAALATVLFVMCVRLYRSFRVGGWKPTLTLRSLLFLLGVGLTILVEFGLEKPQVMPYLRICLLVTGAVLCCYMMDGASHDYRVDGKRYHIVLMALLSVLFMVLTVVTVILLDRSLDWENQLLLAVMAVSMIMMAFVTQHRTDEDRLNPEAQE